MAAQKRGKNEFVSDVELRALDENGRIIDGCRIEKFVNRCEEDFRNRFDGMHGIRIPYGNYTYVVALPRVGTYEPGIRREVAVSLPQQLVVIPVSKGQRLGYSIDRVPTGYVIKGRLVPAPSVSIKAEPIWMRFITTRHEDPVDVPVTDSGEFRVYAPLAGRYTLLVIRGNNILHHQEVHFEDGELEDLVVRMPKVPPETLFVHHR